MLQTKYYLLTFFVLFWGLCFTQNTIDADKGITQNNINDLVKESQTELGSYNYYKAKKKLDEALRLAQKTNKPKSIGVIYAVRGRLEFLLEEYNNALKSLTKAIEIQLSIKDNANLGNTYQTFGDVYLMKRDYFLALDAYTEAKIKFAERKLYKDLAETLLKEGKVYEILKNYKKSRDIIEESLALAKKYGYTSIESEGLINDAKIYSKLGNDKKALEFAKVGTNIAEENQFITLRNNAYLIISDIYYNLEEHKTSRNYLNKHLKLSDSIRTVTQINGAKSEKTQFRLNQEIEKNNEIVLQLEKAKVDINLGTLTSILSVALITILSLLTLSLYKNNIIRINSNKLLQKKNKELFIAKENAELASKSKANFLSTVTHELRTPLYAVTGLSNMLLDENPKPEQVQHLKSLKFSGDYLLAFINDILQINKIEANKVAIESESFNLKKKIDNIILALNSSAISNNVKINFEYDENLPQNFIADQIKISQILINLLGNSIKFTKNGDIWVRVYEINKENKAEKEYTLRFEVEDNGIGISQEKQDHMFESFSQGSIQINRKYGGTGLGLSIVKGLIDILKGKVYVNSKLGRGTTFYFEIPLEYTDVIEEIKNQNKYFKGNPENIDLTKVRVLIVEDNKINQMITKKILTKMNLNCDIVDNGEDAVEIVKQNHYNIILMDIHMPGISGVEATKQIRTFNKELTIFALTAVTIEDKMEEFNDAGFTDVISKPFKQELFERKLYVALSQKSILN